MAIIAPSLLSADFHRLGEEIAAVAAAGADRLHLDVMDGHFVPNITIGPPVIAALRPLTDLPFDVHLMITRPERYLEDFARAGADLIAVHVETSPHLHRTLAEIRRLGCQAGVVLNPATPPEAITYVLDTVDLVLIMTVNPGFGGQSFIPAMLPKVEQVRQMVVQGGFPVRLAVDGGVNLETIGPLAKAGAEVLVAGSAIFGTADYAATIAALRARITAALPEAAPATKSCGRGL
ncbi:MAG: ribulose-phosphate 3-epimerase [Desulfobacca sp.]|uniref:ribulose-phosphate 3-epimerase n=1 Tax=Desulfobacca sp. TaxID=2067990 RepID=UPI0040494BF3